MAVSEYELTRMAEEEMDLARRLSWKEMARVTPWSDTYLAAQFGQPYLDYKARVRRWL